MLTRRTEPSTTTGDENAIDQTRSGPHIRRTTTPTSVITRRRATVETVVRVAGATYDDGQRLPGNNGDRGLEGSALTARDVRIVAIA